jgi:hypothetical protein
MAGPAAVEPSRYASTRQLQVLWNRKGPAEASPFPESETILLTTIVIIPRMADGVSPFALECLQLSRCVPPALCLLPFTSAAFRRSIVVKP